MNNDKARVIIAEDDAIIALDTELKLNEKGYNVVAVVNSGKDCLKSVKEYGPDIVIMDIGLRGDMDGIETATNIRKEFSIPIIYLTGNSDKRTLDRLEQDSESIFLVKPIVDERLFNAMEQVLA